MGAAGCCHPWGRLEIVADAESEAIILDALDQFSQWTGRTRTCVERVEVHDDLGDGVGGRYLPEQRIVNLRRTPRFSTVIHEFCHALDHEEGWASQSGEDALAPYAEAYVKDDDLYPTENARLREAFARICDDGPQLPALLTAIRDLCDVDCGIDAALFVKGIAYPGAAMDESLEGFSSAFTPDLTSHELGGETIEADYRETKAAIGAEGLFLLDTVGQVDPDSGDATLEPELLLVDDGGVRERLPLGAHGVMRDHNGNPVYSAYELLSSDDEPLLLATAGEARGSAWFVSSHPLDLRPTAWPEDLLDGPMRALVSGNSAVLQIASELSLYLVDLGDGTHDELPLTDEGCKSMDFGAIHLDAEGILTASSCDGEYRIEAWSLEGVRAWSGTVPMESVRIRSLFRFPDGSVSVSPVLNNTAVGGTNSVSLWMRYDPSSGEWAIPSDQCMGIGGDGWVMWNDAATWVGARSDDEGSWGIGLTSVALP